jgi:hypothetical protein
MRRISKNAFVGYLTQENKMEPGTALKFIATHQTELLFIGSSNNYIPVYEFL